MHEPAEHTFTTSATFKTFLAFKCCMSKTRSHFIFICFFYYKYILQFKYTKKRSKNNTFFDFFVFFFKKIKEIEEFEV